MYKVDSDGRLILTDELGDVLADIQRQGNKAVTYKTDLENHNCQEIWAYPKEDGLTLYGDCEDIALYKKKLLIEQGIDKNSLLMTICTDPYGRGHCVLCVCTDKRDYLLCNHHETLMRVGTMHREGYKFLYRQRAGHAISEPWAILE